MRPGVHQPAPGLGCALDADAQPLQSPRAADPSPRLRGPVRPGRHARPPFPRQRPDRPGIVARRVLPVEVAAPRRFRRQEAAGPLLRHDPADRRPVRPYPARARADGAAGRHRDHLHQRPRRKPGRPRPALEGMPVLRRPGAGTADLLPPRAPAGGSQERRARRADRHVGDHAGPGRGASARGVPGPQPAAHPDRGGGSRVPPRFRPLRVLRRRPRRAHELRHHVPGRTIQAGGVPHPRQGRAL